VPPFAPRKLLVAVIGAAAVNLACSKSPPTGGNLRAPEPEPSALPPTAGNLMAVPTATAPLEQVPTAPTTVDASAPDASAPAPVRPKRPPTSGNLMAPRPDGPAPGPTTGNTMPVPVKKQ